LRTFIKAAFLLARLRSRFASWGLTG
jgi:hypothetical protein